MYHEQVANEMGDTVGFACSTRGCKGTAVHYDLTSRRMYCERCHSPWWARLFSFLVG